MAAARPHETVGHQAAEHVRGQGLDVEERVVQLLLVQVQQMRRRQHLVALAARVPVRAAVVRVALGGRRKPLPAAGTPKDATAGPRASKCWKYSCGGEISSQKGAVAPGGPGRGRRGLAVRRLFGGRGDVFGPRQLLLVGMPPARALRDPGGTAGRPAWLTSGGKKCSEEHGRLSATYAHVTRGASVIGQNYYGRYVQTRNRTTF